MPSASSSSIDRQELATVKFKIQNENTNNNNIQLYDMANRENGFWSQPEEELFYTPQPLFSLVSQLPFSNAVYVDGDHYLPADADLLFGELDSDDDDESLELVEIEADGIPAVVETVAITPIWFKTVYEAPAQKETVHDKPAKVKIEDVMPFVFADLRSPSRTSSFDPDATEELVVIKTVDNKDILADLRTPSRISNLCPSATEDYHSNAGLSPDTLWDSAVRSSSRMSSLEFLILQASDIDNAVLEATRDALRAACEVDSSTVEGARFLDCALQVTRDTLMATYETDSDGTRLAMGDLLDYINGYEIMRDAVIQIYNGGRAKIFCC